MVCRGGIGATIGTINTQLPYAYVHILYWVIQIFLLVLAIETGVQLAVNIYVKDTGKKRDYIGILFAVPPRMCTVCALASTHLLRSRLCSRCLLV